MSEHRHEQERFVGCPLAGLVVLFDALDTSKPVLVLIAGLTRQRMPGRRCVWGWSVVYGRVARA